MPVSFLCGPAPDQRTEPCTRHAFRGACTVKSPSVNPAVEYQRRSAQLNSVFDIARLARISRRTAAPSQPGIHGVVGSRPPFDCPCF